MDDLSSGCIGDRHAVLDETGGTSAILGIITNSIRGNVFRILERGLNYKLSTLDEYVFICICRLFKFTVPAVQLSICMCWMEI